jgi:hypothetical protein
MPAASAVCAAASAADTETATDIVTRALSGDVKGASSVLRHSTRRHGAGVAVGTVTAADGCGDIDSRPLLGDGGDSEGGTADSDADHADADSVDAAAGAADADGVDACTAADRSTGIGCDDRVPYESQAAPVPVKRSGGPRRLSRLSTGTVVPVDTDAVRTRIASR